MDYLDIKNATFAYDTGNNPVIRNLSLTLKQGEFTVLAGSNGSGKSTLLRLINGLLIPQSGVVMTAGRDTSAPENLLPIRRMTGMVFQDPENQLTATVAEEDTAFGPENLAFPREEMNRAVDEALDITGLKSLRKRSTSALSAGQLQRLALAGVLAMSPECLLLDEPTSMLNPEARRRFLDLIIRLNREKGITVIMASHHEEELLAASRMIIMDKGEIAVDGTPDELFRRENLEQWGLLPPPALTASRLLASEKRDFPLLTGEGELTDALRREDHQLFAALQQKDPLYQKQTLTGNEKEPIIRVKDLSHDYRKGSVMANRALDGVSLTLRPGETAVLIGTTGSGKSTLLQHLNALLLSDGGDVRLLGIGPIGRDTTDDKAHFIREKIGLVMQRPEKQLFERYVGDDVAFAPRQIGLKGKELARRVKEAMDLVGLPFSEFKDRPIHALSGGEKRKAALAGVLALKGDVLLLDEPSAGLDPLSRRELHRILGDLQKQGTSLVIATHDMDEAALLADQVLLMYEGKVLRSGTPSEVFSETDLLSEAGLEAPFIKRVEAAL
ncbi:MAG: ATP-binding cassette domain-containing protein [Spirochaetales bacterium]|nr:ATP-binding cassette domain-containing protein [Spirochaetales bacterium]